MGSNHSAEKAQKKAEQREEQLEEEERKKNRDLQMKRIAARRAAVSVGSGVAVPPASRIGG